jgi:hypothetical protein
VPEEIVERVPRMAILLREGVFEAVSMAGAMTPRMGMGKRLWSSEREKQQAVWQAITRALIPRLIKNVAFSIE